MERILAKRRELDKHVETLWNDGKIDKAIRLAAEEALDFLHVVKGLRREDAYMLMSVGVDLRLTQMVDGTKGAHAMIPKALFVK